MVAVGPIAGHRGGGGANTARPPRAAMAAAGPMEAKLLAVIFLKKFYHNKFEKKKFYHNKFEKKKL